MKTTTRSQRWQRIGESPIPSALVALWFFFLLIFMYAALGDVTFFDVGRSFLGAAAFGCFAGAGQGRPWLRLAVQVAAITWLVVILGIVGYSRYFNALPNLHSLGLLHEAFTSREAIRSVLIESRALPFWGLGTLAVLVHYHFGRQVLDAGRKQQLLLLATGVLTLCISPTAIACSKSASGVGPPSSGPASRHAYVRDIVQRTFFLKPQTALHKYGYLAYLHFHKSSMTRRIDYSRHLENPLVQNSCRQDPPAASASVSKPNFIIVQVESLDARAIGRTTNGSALTPFLNKLKEESIYFPNFYAVHGGGGTADAEFAAFTGLLPPRDCAVFGAHRLTHLPSLARELGRQGYLSVGMHGNSGRFWNRKSAYAQLGFERFFDSEQYSGQAKGFYGLDSLFLEQSIPHLKELWDDSSAVLAYLITNSSHRPFAVAADLNQMDLSYESPLARKYVSAINYVDKSLQTFYNQLEQNGLLENTVFILYGDHSSGVCTEEYDCGKAAGENVPLFIKLPERTAEVREVYGSHLDIAATVLDAAGISHPREMLGSSLLANAEVRQNPIALDAVYSVVGPDGLVPAFEHPDPVYAKMIQYSRSFFYDIPVYSSPGRRERVAGKRRTPNDAAAGL